MAPIFQAAGHDEAETSCAQEADVLVEMPEVLLDVVLVTEDEVRNFGHLQLLFRDLAGLDLVLVLAHHVHGFLLDVDIVFALLLCLVLRRFLEQLLLRNDLSVFLAATSAEGRALKRTVVI